MKIKWLLQGVMIMIIASSVAARPTREQPEKYFVAINGNDNWSGKLPAPNRKRTDGPFATLTRARDAIRELKAKTGGLKKPVTVLVRSGSYYLSQPLVFTPEDSGTNECPITYAAYPKERVVISGGRRIAGWRKVTVNGKELWAVEIPEVREGKWFFRELWVNGQRRFRARHPNKGYLSIAEVLEVTPETQWHQGQTSFRFREGDLKAWHTATAAEVIVMNRWVESRLPLTGVDEKERIVNFGKRTVFKLDPGDLYYVEHAFELLDAPGEWYLDRESGTLYYLPCPGEDMQTIEAIAPVLPQVVRMLGESQIGLYVEYINFRSLAFAHTEWQLPPEIAGFGQAAVGVPGAVYGEGVHKCVLENCTFAHLGTYALELSRGCHHNRIISCRIFDLGAGGIKIGEQGIRDSEAEQTHDNEIAGCYIHDGGLVFHSAVGIWVGQSFKNRIVHNEIANFYYTGISIGWTWGYGKSLAGGNLVELNHIHHIGVRSDGDGPILSDMGGIYTLGIQDGTTIRNNLWHDIAGFRYGGWGIYFDEGSTNIVAENNIVYNTTHGGFHQHYGKENLVRNNIFAYARDHQIQASRPESHLRFRFEGNIVLGRSSQWIAGSIDFNFVFDRNLYWREGGEEIRFGNLSWEEWRAKGMDRNSLIADPKFVAPEKSNFRLKPNSPALKLGFKPISIERVGPKGLKQR